MPINNDDLIVEGIPEGEVVYPLLASLFADTKIGKTFFGASFPNAVLIDFPPAKLSFGKVEIDQMAITRTFGEGFRSVFAPFRKPDASLAWKPKIDRFDYRNQYHFPKSWEDFQTAIEKAKFYAEDVALVPNAGKVWVILDDSYRWRAMEIVHYLQVNRRKWPSQQEFGLITQAMASQITAIQNFANVLVIHRTTKDFDTGLKVPLVYPTSTDFNSDVSIELIHRDSADGKSKHQIALIHSTGHDFPCMNPDYQVEVIDPTPIDVLAAAKIPRPFW
jgi:hypothetical protein